MKLRRVATQHGRYYDIEDLAELAPNGRVKQRWHPLTRVDEGEPALLKALAIRRGEALPEHGNLPKFLEEFAAENLPHLSVSARSEYRRMYDVIKTAFLQFDAAGVEPGTVDKFLADNFTGKLNTKGKYKARLSEFFSWCVRNSRTGVKVNPCREIKVPSPRKKKGLMSAPIYWAFHDALTPMGQCFLELTFLTLQRPTEIRLLRDSQIDPKHAPGFIQFLPTKTEDSSGEDVLIPITPQMRASINRARSLRPQRKVELLDRRRDPFIIQTREGDGYTKTGLYEVWRDAADATGNKDVTTRHIRPFAGAMAKKQGYNKEDVQQAYAHASITTTEVYLEQHRERKSVVELAVPERVK